MPYVRPIASELAQLNGALRFTHLNVHIDTTQVLTPEQTDAYDRLRGYGAHAH